MREQREVTFTVEFGGRKLKAMPTQHSERAQTSDGEIPRISRLMALAIRLEELVRNGSVRDYADVARRGRVTRARMTQIMRLLNLAPDIQEQILFLSPGTRLNERNLRPIVRRIDWLEQRRLYQDLTSTLAPHRDRA